MEKTKISIVDYWGEDRYGNLIAFDKDGNVVGRVIKDSSPRCWQVQWKNKDEGLGNKSFPGHTEEVSEKAKEFIDQNAESSLGF